MMDGNNKVSCKICGMNTDWKYWGEDGEGAIKFWNTRTGEPDNSEIIKKVERLRDYKTVKHKCGYGVADGCIFCDGTGLIEVKRKDGRFKEGINHVLKALKEGR